MRRRLGKGTVCDKLFICITRCVRKFHIFSYQCRPGGRWRKYGFEWKTDQKSEITGVEIAWVEEKSNRYPLYYIRKWPAWKDKHIGWLLECNTHAFCCRPRNFKILTKILKSISQEIGSNFWYLQNQLDELNQFQFFEKKKMPTQKSYSDF